MGTCRLLTCGIMLILSCFLQSPYVCLQRNLAVIRKTLLTLLTHLYGLNTLAGTYLYELSLIMQYWVGEHHH